MTRPPRLKAKPMAGRRGEREKRRDGDQGTEDRQQMTDDGGRRSRMGEKNWNKIAGK